MPILGRPETVFCAVCFRRIAKAGAAMVESSHGVAYFCSRECYDQWMREPGSPEHGQRELPRDEQRP